MGFSLAQVKRAGPAMPALLAKAAQKQAPKAMQWALRHQVSANRPGMASQERPSLEVGA